MSPPVLLETPLPNLAHRGKVRDIYDLGDRLLIVATDRISAFDVVLPDGIPDKGAVLTQISAFWFQRTASVVPSHFLRLADGSPEDELPFELPAELVGRSTIVRKAERIILYLVSTAPLSCETYCFISASVAPLPVSLPSSWLKAIGFLPS